MRPTGCLRQILITVGLIVSGLMASGLTALAATPDLGASRPPPAKSATGGGARPPVPPTEAAALPGDTIAYPLPIDVLPFSDSGTTCGRADDYDAACDYAATAPDMVYAYTPPVTMRLDIDLCGSAYDTKVFLLDADANVLACNEDYYGPGDPCGTYVSRLYGAQVPGGQTVYIVLDGYADGCGDFELNVREYEPCDLACPGGQIEGEPPLHDHYVDRFNSGCNTPALVPAITTLNADATGDLTFCGTSGFYVTGGLDYRDTDWFAITLGPTGEATWTLDAEQTTVGYVLQMSCPQPGIYGIVVAGPCEPGQISIIGQPGTNVGLWIGPPRYEAPIAMDGHEYAYHFTLTGLSPHQPVAVEAISWGGVKVRYR
jgi:hypothetical protein